MLNNFLVKRALCKKSLYHFVKYTTPLFQEHRWQKDLCTTLELLTDGTDASGSRLRLHAAPQVGKSLIVSKRFALWLLVKNPLARIAIVTYNNTFATQFYEAIKNSQVWVNEIFPELKLTGSLRNGLVTEERKKIGDGSASIIFTSIQNGYTGRGVDYLIIDDPIKNLQEALSPAFKEQVRSFFEETVMPRSTDKTSMMLMYHTWAVGDIGFLLQEKYNFIPYRFAAVSDGEADDPTNTWRKPGELLSPLLSQKIIDEVKTQNPAEYWAKYQGIPIVKEDVLFSNLEIVDKYDHSTIWVRAYDTATSIKQSADYTASVLIGISSDGHIIIKDSWAERLTLPKLKKKIIDTALKDGNDIPIIVENKNIGTALLQELHTEPQLAAYQIHGENITGDKLSRSSALATRNDYIQIVKNEGSHKLKAQLESFTGKGHGHDDLVDACTLGYNYLAKQGITSDSVKRYYDKARQIKY